MEERLGGKQDDEAKRNELAEHFGDDLLFADNFNNAIIGVSMGISCGTKVVYDAEEMARTLVVSEGITKEEAEKQYDNNLKQRNKANEQFNTNGATANIPGVESNQGN